VINTSENHSEVYGPYADWRRSFTEGVSREGKGMDDPFAARFGLCLAQIRAMSEQFFEGIRSR
jgi:hypothetical protein